MKCSFRGFYVGITSVFYLKMALYFCEMNKKDITQLSYEITGLEIKVHKELGPGLLESVYEKCLK